MNFTKLSSSLYLSIAFALLGCSANQMQESYNQSQQIQGNQTISKANVIEIATFTLKPEVSYEQFAPLDKAVEVEHVSKQLGFVSRETAKGENGEWIVVVHWETLQDADASMGSFANAPASADFMAGIDLDTMKMTRYSINK